MKMKPAILILFFFLSLTSSFQCNKCRTDDLYLDGTKSWFPLKGKTQLTFADQTGNLTNFKLRVVDSTEVEVNQECGTSYKYEYITTTLYLNISGSDSVFFSLASAGWLCIRAMTGTNPNIVMCNVFGQTKQGIIAKRLSNQTLGSRTYPETILLLHNQGYSDNIDSVYIGNNVGIVAFKYANKRYTLQ